MLHMGIITRRLQPTPRSINLDINQNVLKCARLSGVKKLVSCLSSTAYPRSILCDETSSATEDQLSLGPPAESVSGYDRARAKEAEIRTRTHTDTEKPEETAQRLRQRGTQT